MGPQWEYLLKATHYSGRPQVQSKYACRLPAKKVQIKRTLNLRHSSQYHVCKMYKPDPLVKSFLFEFFILSFMVFTTRERCEMVHKSVVAYHFGNDQSFLLLVGFSISLFLTYDLCNMWQM